MEIDRGAVHLHLASDNTSKPHRDRWPTMRNHPGITNHEDVSRQGLAPLREARVHRHTATLLLSLNQNLNRRQISPLGSKRLDRLQEEKHLALIILSPPSVHPPLSNSRLERWSVP